MFSLRSSLVFSLALSAGVFAQSAAEKVAKLRAAATSVDRINLLEDKDFVFDFLHQSVGETDGAGGHTVAATSSNMPSLIGNGMAMTIGFLGPCGMNTPHTHPRATEFNFAVNGSLQAGLLVENGARFIMNELPPGSAAIFPKGAIHFEFNNACEPALFVAAFNDEDPGVDQVAQRFFGLPPAILQATLGGVGIEVIAELEAKIPDNISLGTEECIKRCGLNGNSFAGQPTKQRQPRVSGNAFPSGVGAPPATNVAKPTTAATAHDEHWTGTPSTTGAKSRRAFTPSRFNARSLLGYVSQETFADAIGAATGFTDANGGPNVVVIALLVVVCVLAAGYIALGAAYFIRRRRERTTRTRGGVYFKTGSQFAPQGAVFEGEKAQPFESYNHEHERTTPYDAPSGHA